MAKKARDITVDGVPENQVTINGWQYTRITDSLINAILILMNQHMEHAIDVKMGRSTATNLDVAFWQIDRDLLDGTMKEAVLRGLEKEMVAENE